MCYDVIRIEVDNMVEKDLKQIKFERNNEVKHLNKLIDTLKMTNMRTYKMILKHLKGEELLEGEFDGENTTIILPSDNMVKEMFGSIKLVFKGKGNKNYDLLDIQPRQYFEDCHSNLPVMYKGFCIPNKQLYKFKVNYYLTLHK